MNLAYQRHISPVKVKIMLREESVAFLAEKQKNRNHYMIIVWGIDVKIFVYKDSWFPEDKILLTLVPHANEVNMYACMYL